MEEMCDTPAE